MSMSMTPRTPVRILLADDHTLLREALREVLSAEPGFLVVGEAGSGPVVVEQAALLCPDVVLLDVQMPGNHPPATVQALRAASPGCSVVILSMHDDPRLVRALMNLGVAAFLHKSVSRRDLASVIRAAARHDRLVTVSVSRDVFSAPEPEEDTQALSYRERQVLTLVSQAMTNRQIAVRLHITEGTVKRHLRNIFGKLDAVSRIDAVNRATNAALIPISQAG